MQISRLTLRLHFYLLGYDRNIFESSMKVFGNLRRVILGNVRKRVCENAQTIFEESSEVLEMWREIFGKSQKPLFQYVYIINKIILSRSSRSVFHIFVCIILSVTCLS